MTRITTPFRRLTGSRWAVPVAAATFIATSRLAGLGAHRAGSGPWGVTSDLLMIGAALVAGYRIALAAIRALRARSVGIDLLVTVAALGALAQRNYWEAAAVTTLFAVGHALEQMTMARTRSALAELVSSAPDRAIVVRDGVEVEVPAGQVQVGETVVVKAGATLPVDGTVLAGSAFIDESGITGESVPAQRAVGDPVWAGTVQTSGHLRIEATRVGGQTTLARIIRRVEDAQDEKARTQSFMERFARWYTPGIIVLAVLAGLLSRDLDLALTLLVIGCPGALVISIPVAIVAGIGRGARDGVLIKGGEHLERAAAIDTVAFDKTGTLTRGRPQLTDVVVLDPRFSREEVLTLAARAEIGSEHPLARPIVEAAGLGFDPGSIFEPVAGQGIVAVVDGRRIVVGRPELAAERFGGLDVSGATTQIERLGALGRTAMAVAVDGTLVGVVAVADTPRPEAAAAVAALRRAGVKHVVMLTGDRESVARAVAAQVGVDEVHAGLLPEDKLEVIAALQAEGRHVAMVGDGVNDAPALARADIGVAMGAAGSGLAVDTADIALMADRLDRLPEALHLARSTVRVMRQNIVVALVTVAALLVGVFVGGVTMSIGMLVHEASVLLVIVNAMRLLRARRPRAATRPQLEEHTLAA